MAKSFRRIIKVNFYATCFTILFLIFFPICFLLFIPIYLFRFLATQARKVVRPDLGKLVQTRSAVIAGTDSPYDNPQWNLTVWLVMEGTLEFEQFRKNFYKNIVLKKKNNGELHSPEWRQYFVHWLGFAFWKWEKDFQIEDHIRYMYPEDKEKVVHEDGLQQLVKKLAWEPFQKEKSPWEFMFIPNYQEKGSDTPDKCVLFYRVHHGFCDGFSILHLLMREVNNVSMVDVAKPVKVKRSLLYRIVHGLLFWISCPYLLMKMVVRTVDKNDWHLPQEKVTKPFNIAFTKIIPLSFIKDIKNMHKVCFSTLIYASLTGALRSMMLEMGKNVPEQMSTAVAVPMPGHPKKLRNHFIFSFLQLPLGIEDPMERLRKVERNIQRLKKSPVPYFNFWLIPVIGATFSSCMRLISPNKYSTVLTSNFPGPPIYGDFTGAGGCNRVVDMNFSAGLGEGNVGIGFCMMSYGDGMRIITSFTESILATDELVERFNEKILAEMEQYKFLGIYQS